MLAAADEDTAVRREHAEDYLDQSSLSVEDQDRAEAIPEVCALSVSAARGTPTG
jgi:hypothetical protein